MYNTTIGQKVITAKKKNKPRKWVGGTREQCSFKQGISHRSKIKLFLELKTGESEAEL